MKLSEINIAGNFCKKAMIHCKTKDDMIFIYKELIKENKSTIDDIEKYAFPKNGVIVKTRQTLMQWGYVYVSTYSEKKFNKLLSFGYGVISIKNNLPIS